MPTAITRFWVASRGRPTTPADDTDPHLLRLAVATAAGRYPMSTAVADTSP
jgi:hypothetical protein